MPEEKLSEKPVSLQYYEAGNEFFEKNYVLLGCHVTDASQSIGDLEPEVKKALNRLAVATANTMTKIMMNVNNAGRSSDG